MSEPTLITVMLVDDHFVVRSGLATSLNLEDDIEVIAESESGEECIERYRECLPTIVMMDLQLPGISGIEAATELLEVDPKARVLMFSTFARDDEIQTALDAGVLGYLQKSVERDELLEAIRLVAAGQSYLPPGLADHLSTVSLGPTITGREREILALVARGHANKEIADELNIAQDTVKRHVSNILQKLNVSDRAQATAEAIRRGIVKVGE